MKNGVLLLTGPCRDIRHATYSERGLMRRGNRHRLPALYSFRWFAEIDGLLSYVIDSDDMFRRASSYVDRILKGGRPPALPLQAPEQVRAGHQPQDHQGARPRHAENI
jgi:ABC-type uncharacterized transport system substrate-binding protein